MSDTKPALKKAFISLGLDPEASDTQLVYLNNALFHACVHAVAFNLLPRLEAAEEAVTHLAWLRLGDNYPAGTIDDDAEWAEEMVRYYVEDAFKEARDERIRQR